MTDKPQPFTPADLKVGEQIVRELHGLNGYDAWAEHVAKAIAAARESFDIIAVRNAALEEAAKIAETGCLVPPDGGSPTEEEREMCENIASAIRIHKLCSVTRPDGGGK